MNSQFDLPFINKLLFLQVAFILLFLCCQVNVRADSPLPKVIADQAKGMLDKGVNYTKVKQILDEALKLYPDSAELNYQMARYLLKIGYIEQEGIISYRYKPEIEKEVIRRLKKNIENHPEHVETYSLLGHVYAVQNKLEEAQKYLEKAANSKKKIPWLAFNQALFFVQKKDYKTAVILLRSYTKKHKKENDSQYVAAWKILHKLALIDPKLDPYLYAYKGVVKRVLPQDIAGYIKKNNHDKLMFVHFASQDTWCSYCVKNAPNTKVSRAIAER